MLTEEQLLSEMRKLGGENLTTRQFAELITPFIRADEDWVGHCRWDMALSHVRALMRKLAKKGLVEMRLDSSLKRRCYLYSLTEKIEMKK